MRPPAARARGIPPPDRIPILLSLQRLEALASAPPSFPTACIKKWFPRQFDDPDDLPSPNSSAPDPLFPFIRVTLGSSAPAIPALPVGYEHSSSEEDSPPAAHPLDLLVDSQGPPPYSHPVPADLANPDLPLSQRTVDDIILRWRRLSPRSVSLLESSSHFYVESASCSHRAAIGLAFDLLGVEQMAVPCCTGGHWLLLLLTRRPGLPSTITTFNSLGSTQSRPCLLAWLTFLRAPIPTLSGWPLSWTAARAFSPQQASGSQDCGLFLLYNLAAVINPAIRSRPWPSPPEMRRRLAFFLA